jgi:hypothetical protein
MVEPQTFAALVRSRRRFVREFLDWAAEHEASGRSLRLEHRDDVVRCQSIIGLFETPWWAVCVYSCFDSCLGARVAAADFRRPASAWEARRALADLDLPPGSVQHHRGQIGRKRSKRSLQSVCEHASELESTLCDPGSSFDERFRTLRSMRIEDWGRTTSFDALVRAGVLEIGGRGYRPTFAYLRDSTGPTAGFRKIWGCEVRASNADACESLLRTWTERWHETVRATGARWSGRAYDSGDLENALCVYQERQSVGAPTTEPKTTC